MKKKAPKPRNAAAYAMATGVVRNAKHRDKTKYTRKTKHKKRI